MHFEPLTPTHYIQVPGYSGARGKLDRSQHCFFPPLATLQVSQQGASARRSALSKDAPRRPPLCRSARAPAASSCSRCHSACLPLSDFRRVFQDVPPLLPSVLDSPVGAFLEQEEELGLGPRCCAWRHCGAPHIFHPQLGARQQQSSHLLPSPEHFFVFTLFGYLMPSLYQRFRDPSARSAVTSTRYFLAALTCSTLTRRPPSSVKVSFMHSRVPHRSIKGAMATDLRPSVFSRYVVMWVNCLKSFFLVNFGIVAKAYGDDSEAIK